MKGSLKWTGHCVWRIYAERVQLVAVRATAVGRDVVLAGDLKGLVYYVMID